MKEVLLMKKILSLMLVLTLMIAVIPFAAVSAEGVITLSETEETVLLPSDSTKSNITDFDKAMENGYTVVSPNYYFEYTVAVQTAGFFDIEVGFGSDSEKKFTSTIDGTKCTIRTVEKTESLFDIQRRCIRGMYLTEGEHVIKITSNIGQYYFDKVYIVPKGAPKISENGEELAVNANMFTSTSTTAPTLYATDDLVAYAKNGTVYYLIDAPVDGIYKLGIKYGVPYETAFTTSVKHVETETSYGKKIATTLPATQNYNVYNKGVLRYVSLKAGENAIAISGNNAAWVTELYFTLCEGLPLAEEGEAKFDASYAFTSASSYKIDTPYFTPLSGGNVTYTVDVKKTGFYNLNLYMGAGAERQFSTRIDGSAESVSYTESTGGLTKIAKRTLRTVYLTEGVHTIRIKQDVGSSNTWIQHVSFDNYSAGIPLAEEGEAKFDAAYVFTSASSYRIDTPYFTPLTGGNVTYTVNAKKAGYYNVNLYMGANGARQFSTKIDDGAEAVTFTETTGALTTMAKRTLRTVYLAEGIHTVRIKQDVGAENTWIRYVSFDEYSESIALSAETGVEIPAYNYSKANSIRTEYNSGLKTSVVVPYNNGWTEYEVSAPSEGLYDISLELGSAVDRTFTTTINGESEETSSCAQTGGLTTLATRRIRSVLLNEGKNTIKIKNDGYEFYLKSIIIAPNNGEEVGLAVAEELTPASTYTAYKDSTMTNGVEKINDGTAFELRTATSGNEYFEYKVNVPFAGEYGFAISYAAADTDEKIISYSINGAEAVNVTVAGTGTLDPGTFVFTNLQKITLSKGENTIRISTAQGIWYTEGFKLYFPGVNFYDKKAGGDPVAEIAGGTLYGKILFGGYMVGENVDCYMAVYEIDSSGARKLIGADVLNVTVSEKTVTTLKVEGIEKKADCTYQAKIFMWQDMAGRSYELK